MLFPTRLSLCVEKVKGRRKKEAKERKENRYCFVDDMSLEDDANPKLELHSEEGDKNDASNNKFYFTLKVCSDSRKEVTNVSTKLSSSNKLLNFYFLVYARNFSYKVI